MAANTFFFLPIRVVWILERAIQMKEGGKLFQSIDFLPIHWGSLGWQEMPLIGLTIGTAKTTIGILQGRIHGGQKQESIRSNVVRIILKAPCPPLPLSDAGLIIRSKMPTILALASGAPYKLLKNCEAGIAMVPLAPLLNLHFDIALPGSQPLIRRGPQRRSGRHCLGLV
jgi:hypothetical protein